jgi:alpha-beta hydrolase superfamily lysophospholipase
MALSIEEFNTSSEGVEISGVIHWPAQLPAPCIICSHGLFSSKASSKFVAVTEHLAANGFVAVRYDHRGCGESQGQIENTTVSGRIQDLEAVYHHARQQPNISDTFALMGSSMGGYISLFMAAKYSVFSALAVWATPFEIRRPSKSRKATDLPVLKNEFYNDLIHYRLGDILNNLNRCLILHGQKDELVPVEHAHKIYQRLREPKTIDIIAGADHRFSDNHHRRQAIERTVTFFRQYLQ